MSCTFAFKRINQRFDTPDTILSLEAYLSSPQSDGIGQASGVLPYEGERKDSAMEATDGRMAEIQRARDVEISVTV